MLVNDAGEGYTGWLAVGDAPQGGRLYRAAKACMDRLCAAGFLVLLSPVMAAIALSVRLDSPGPILFRQERVGEGGRVFIIYKFRTMHNGADTSVHQNHVAKYIRGEGTTLPVRKIEKDVRVTRLGRILRKSSLDELPQLFNVLRGELSLVGPRPPIPYEVEEYEEWHMRRLQVKPGITGLWQVTARSQTSFDQMVFLDIKYIQERSLLLDILILLKTIPAVVSGKGAG